MGFFNIFKKKGEDTTQPTIETSPQTNNPTTTKSVDEKATFEIPDFSEEDLDFDLGIDEFMPKENENPLEELKEDSQIQIPDQLQELEEQNPLESEEPQEQLNTPAPKESFQENQEEEFELPEIEITENQQEPFEEEIELPVFEEKEQSTPVFLEREKLGKIQIHSRQINQDLKDQILLLKNIHEDNDTELKLYSDINKEYEDIQHNLLYIDQKLFG